MSFVLQYPHWHDADTTRRRFHDLGLRKSRLKVITLEVMASRSLKQLIGIVATDRAGNTNKNNWAFYADIHTAESRCYAQLVCSNPIRAFGSWSSTLEDSSPCNQSKESCFDISHAGAGRCGESMEASPLIFLPRVGDYLGSFVLFQS